MIISPATMAKHAARLFGAKGAGNPISISWTTTVGGTVDPVTGATVGGTKVRNLATIYASVHFVEFAKNQVRQFAEVQEGDVILDLAPSVDLSAKPGLRFEIQGAQYEQAKVSPELASHWDAVIRGVRISRGILLTRAR